MAETGGVETATGDSRRPLSLRARLILGILALLTLVIVVVGVASGLALRGFLVGQLDNKLSGAAERATHGILDPSPDDRDGFVVPAQGPGTVAVVVDAGGAVATGRLDETGVTTELSPEQRDAVLGAQGADRIGRETVVVPELGEYRVIRKDLPNGGQLAIGMPLAEVHATVGQLWVIIGLIGAVALAGAAALGALVVRIALRPLDRVVATASTVSSLPLDRDAALAVRVPDADERTEVGRVAASINRMLDHVGDALESRAAGEQKLRRFVADASHELRTPLASIRGYSELTRRSGEEIPEPIAHALRRIESESVRMTTLVEDLLLLARLDEESALESAPVDLTELLIAAVSDARVTGPEHAWRLDIPEQPVVVVGDAARLHQVAANLLSNARRHTPAGTTVTALLSVDADTATMEVCDDGPGIDPELVPNIFGRFVRGDASRARATGSTGLGLAIVHAVSIAHGGTAQVESERGRTTVRIRIPRNSEQDE